MLAKDLLSKWMIISFFLLLVSAVSLVAAAEDAGSFFDEIQKDPDFVTSRGIFVPFEKEEGITDMSLSPAYACWENLTEIEALFSGYEGYVIGFSYAGDGFMIVELDSALSDEIDDSMIDGIYQRIDDYCKQEGVSDVPVVFMWGELDEDMPLPDYGPQIFVVAENEPNFIATRGVMPVIEEEGAKREWNDLLVEGSRDNRDIDRYFLAEGGTLLAFGTSINGYLFVELDSSYPEKVNDSLIDEVYGVISKDTEPLGITDVPVVFRWGEVPVECEDIAPEEEVSSQDEGMVTIMDENGNYIDVHEDEVYIDDNGNYILKSTESAKQIPGFGWVIAVFGMMFWVGIKSK